MRISDWGSDVCSSDLLPQAFERSPNLAAALTKGVNDGIFSIYVQYTTLHQIVTGQLKLMELSGPIRMAKMSAHTLSLGLLPFLYLMALISIAVGIMNLLPIPGLDGGHLLTSAVVGVMRRDLISDEHTSETQSLMCIWYSV